MQLGRIITTTTLACALSGSIALAQGFDSGSNGSFGPIDITVDTTLITPPDGIFHATTINVATGATLRFTKNALNSPIHLLATGDITVDGTISVSAVGTIAGPGGFDGGQLPNGDGEGPGAGLGGNFQFGDGGAYGSAPAGGRPNAGAVYGNTLLIPLVGGSGGGTAFADAGGGGGGAILLASNTRTTLNGSIQSIGGQTTTVERSNGGSGGGIRIVAPQIMGQGSLHAHGGFAGFVLAGSGRIRLDVIDASSLQLTTFGVATTGKFMTVFPSPLPKLDIIDVAGQAIPLGGQDSVAVMLPFGASTMQTIIVQAEDFAGLVPIDVVVTAEGGARTVFPAEIDMAAGNPAQVSVPIDLPLNVVARIHVWTR